MTKASGGLTRLRELGVISSESMNRQSAVFLDEVKAFFAVPRDFGVVEVVERVLIEMWTDVLGAESEVSLANRVSCSAFFSALGFLYKYKVYGVKIALPFGYSVFQLKEREGFSFQLHSEPKLEGFHILDSNDGGCVYVARLDEWEKSGAETVGRAFKGSTLIGVDWLGHAWRPSPGDVVQIVDTHTVHTVVGCVLEEYASCSVDSVVRLFDQNVRVRPKLPRAHPSVGLILRNTWPELPRRHLARNSGGWFIEDGVAPGRVIESDSLRGWRFLLKCGQNYSVDAGADQIVCIVLVRGSCIYRLDGTGESIARAPGDVVVLPPFTSTSLSASEESVLAIHRVAGSTALIDWSR